MTHPSSPGPSRRRALLRTTIIVVAVVAVGFALALLLTRRLISTWQP
jgi:hypothetical protein